MNYSVKLYKKVSKFLTKLDKITELNLRVRLLHENPYHFLEHFEGEDCYKFRMGKYRALIDVDDSNKVVWVRVIGHRRDIYK